MGIRHRRFVKHVLRLTAAECDQCHKMVLCLGKLLLRFLDTCQGLVETFHGSLTNTFHRTAAVEDYHIEDLRLLHLLLVLYFFHHFKHLLVI